MRWLRVSNQITSLSLEYSLKEYLSSLTGIDVEILYSGIESPTNLPYIRLRNVPSFHNSISKNKETIEAVYNFEVILFAETRYELGELRNIITKSLIFDEIPYYNSDGEETNYKLIINDGITESPVFPSNIENETSYHQVTYDFSITVTYHKNKN